MSEDTFANSEEREAFMNELKKTNPDAFVPPPAPESERQPQVFSEAQAEIIEKPTGVPSNTNGLESIAKPQETTLDHAVPEEQQAPVSISYQNYPFPLRVARMLPPLDLVIDGLNKIVNLKKTYAQKIDQETLEKIAKSPWAAAHFLKKLSMNERFSSHAMGYMDAIQMVAKRNGETYMLLVPALGKINEGKSNEKEAWRQTIFSQNEHHDAVRAGRMLPFGQKKPAVSLSHLIEMLGNEELAQDWQFDVEKRAGPTKVAAYTTSLAIFPGAPIAYWVFMGNPTREAIRTDMARAIDQFVPKFGFDLADPARDLPNTAKNIETQRKDLTVEENIGKIDPKYDIGKELEAAIQILRETDAEYNTASETVGKVWRTTSNYVHETNARILDALSAPINQTAEMLGLQGAIDSFGRFNDETAWRQIKPYIKRDQPDVYNQIESKLQQGISFSQARSEVLQGLKEKKGSLELDQRIENAQGAANKAEIGVQEFLSYVKSIRQTYDLRSDLAELIEGYGNVVEQALKEYRETRNEEALKEMETYLQREDVQETIRSIEQSFSSQQSHLREYLKKLEQITEKTEARVDTLKEVRSVFVELGELRTEYHTLGQNYAVEEQLDALKSLDEKLEAASEKTDAHVATAQADPEYMKVNSPPRNPSDLAYVLTDSMMVVGPLLIYAAAKYITKIFKR